MPLFFYLPYIMWVGMVSAAQDDLRPEHVKVRKP